ncbi:MAG: tRNA-dihydrouridine synthase [Candidatus Heimdallarchaeota archaeon]
MNLSNPSLLSAMAGITDGKFAVRALHGGAGGAILGSFNIDRQALSAAHLVRKRGRLEFCHPLDSLAEQLSHEVKLIRSSHKKENIFLSLRFSESESLHNIISELSDRISSNLHFEINAHCRQMEITSVGGGQSLLKRPQELQKAIDILKAKGFLISVKARSPSLACQDFAKRLAGWGVDFFHLDAYTPGKVGPDLEAIRAAATAEDITIIGNNSITDSSLAQQVLSCGAKCFSIARAAMNNPEIIGEIAKNLRTTRNRF